MSLTTSEMTPADIAAVTGNNNGNGNNCGWGGDCIWFIVLFLIFGMFGWGGYGGFGGGFGGAGANGALTRADLVTETNFSQLENGVRGIQQGICDSTYALNNSINTLGMQVSNGFHGVDNAICNLGYQTQQGFNTVDRTMLQAQNALMAQIAQCCCDNRMGQADIKNQMSQDTCAVQNTIQNTTRDVIENQNANSRAILDALNANYIRTLESENQSLKLSASQANQNAVLMAAMDANKAEILRRTGSDCPIPAYVVQPPTQVTFPTNCCGNFNGGWNRGGCGCGSCA